MPRHASPTVLALPLAAALFAPAARAQTAAEEAARRILIDQAEHLSDAGDHAQALERATRAAQIRQTPSLWMLLAEEQLAVGQLAAAFVSADRCGREAEQNPALANRDAILERCREVARDARRRAGVVVVRVAEPARAGLRVRVAGEPMSPDLFGAPYLVAPGALVVEASAPGAAPFRQEITVAPGTTRTIDVALPVRPGAVVAASASGGGPLPVAEPVPAVVTAREPADTAAPRPDARRYVGPLVLVGVGGAALGSAAAFFALRQSALGACTVGSEQIECPTADAASRARAAPTYNALMDATLGVGVAAVAGSVVWYVLERHAHDTAPDARRASVVFSPTPQGAVLGIHGAM